jgi:hypothetical protein
VQHEYVPLVEAYREHRKDLLAAHLDALIRLLRGESRAGEAVRAGGARHGRVGLGAHAGGTHAVAGAGARHRAGSRGRARVGRWGGLVGSSAGLGRQPPQRADERAQTGPMVGDGLCLRSARPALGARVAGRGRAPTEPAAPGADCLAAAQAVVPDARPVARPQGVDRAGALSAVARPSRSRWTGCSTT